MSIIHAWDVGNGDMFSIEHNSDNFTIIDCNISTDNKRRILDGIDEERRGKSIERVISTHPDQDHIGGLVDLDDRIQIINFYVVDNEATKAEETDDFKRYKKLRDGEKAFKMFRGCSRYWMNRSNEVRGAAGINVVWPIRDNQHFKAALKEAKEGGSPNNISPVVTYSLQEGIVMGWFGDLEKDFMGKIKDSVKWPEMHVIVAPHHGRESGKIPKEMLNDINPKLVIIGEAPSEHLNYYRAYNTITQNTAGEIYFECETGWTHIYVGNENYSVDFLEDKAKSTYDNYIYIGSLKT